MARKLHVWTRSRAALYGRDSNSPFPNHKQQKVLNMSVIEHNHPVWKESFSEDRRQEQLHEDSEAWHAVTGILLAIVSIGAALAVFTVLICV